MAIFIILLFLGLVTVARMTIEEEHARLGWMLYIYAFLLLGVLYTVEWL